MKKLTVTLLAILFSFPLQASPIATFGTQAVQTNTTTTVKQTVPDIQLEPLSVDTQLELALVKTICADIRSWSTLAYSTLMYAPGMNITETEFDKLYTIRLASHKDGSKPFPVRYLPLDYDGEMTVADPNGLDKTIMYQVVLGYPVFYKIERYTRPSSYKDLQNLPTLNSDRLDTTMTGFTSKIGTLILN